MKSLLSDFVSLLRPALPPWMYGYETLRMIRKSVHKKVHLGTLNKQTMLYLQSHYVANTGRFRLLMLRQLAKPLEGPGGSGYPPILRKKEWDV